MGWCRELLVLSNISFLGGRYIESDLLSDLWITVPGSKSTRKPTLSILVKCMVRTFDDHYASQFFKSVVPDMLGGRGSTATQPTHRELAPKHAAGKVPVPWGRECHWETRRP